MKLNQHKDKNLLLEAQESTSLETSNTTNFHEERNLSLNTHDELMSSHNSILQKYSSPPSKGKKKLF